MKKSEGITNSDHVSYRFVVGCLKYNDINVLTPILQHSFCSNCTGSVFQRVTPSLSFNLKLFDIDIWKFKILSVTVKICLNIAMTVYKYPKVVLNWKLWCFLIGVLEIDLI